MESKAQAIDIIAIYEYLRKERTTRVVKGSNALRNTFQMDDGPQQRERDRQMAQLEPFQGHPNPWADPEIQTWLFTYDAYAEAEEAWSHYKKYGLPGAP